MDNNIQEVKREKVRVIPIKFFKPFPDHPYKVAEDEAMLKLVESIQNNGVLEPILARRISEEEYEIVAGHRRIFASSLAGLEVIPTIVREMTRDEAIIAMVDSNCHREKILPSEKAFAYKMKMEAMKRQGKRTDLTSNPLGGKLKGKETADMVGEEAGESANQVRRYIRLTYLHPKLLQMVDEEKIAFRPAVEISYLTETEQADLLTTIESEECTPSLSQAIRMKEKSQEGKLDMDEIFSIMTEEKANQKEKLKISMERLEKFFARGTPPKQIEETIMKALAFYRQRKREEKDTR